MRKHPLENDNFYHIFTRSISQHKIFPSSRELSRFSETVKFYQFGNSGIKYSVSSKNSDNSIDRTNKLVEIIAYCIMPTHIHLILKQLKKNGISDFMRYVLNSYTRYFNIKNNRKGPLWEGRFKSVLIENNDYLLHLTRYIHLNPVTSYLVKKPEQWKASSYTEYLNEFNQRLTNMDGIFDFTPETYKEFVEDGISYQQELARIKHLTLE